MTPREILDAIGRASASFPALRSVPSWKRAEALRRIHDGVERRRAEFIGAIIREARKPVRFASAEVDRCLVTLRLAAEEATRTPGEVLPVDLERRSEGAWCVVERFPRGPVAALTPFNFPLNLLVHKVAPAIACACPVVAKPSPRTPAAAALLAEEIVRSGWPEGGFELVLCDNSAASPLWRDDRIAVVSFTGSDTVGWRIKEEAPRKSVVLELGGNAGAIVHDDADLQSAAEKLAMSAFAYAGQVCIKAQRIFVQRRVFDEFLRLFDGATGSLAAGSLDDPRTVLSPMIDEEAAMRVESWVREAESAGAKILRWGDRQGDFCPPAILTSVPVDAKVVCREIFGPVAVVEPYGEIDEAIRRVNDSAYGLQAAVFTRDVARIRLCYAALSVGGVLVNDPPSTRIDNYPYGGVKASGAGREGVRSAILEYTEPRVLLISFP